MRILDLFQFLLLYHNQLSTERYSFHSRRCPDAGVGQGFGLGVFGCPGIHLAGFAAAFTHLGGSESSWMILYGTQINPDGVRPNGEHILLPLFGVLV